MGITNGGFETGDLTGWGDISYTDGFDGPPIAETDVTTGAADTGTYGLRHYVEIGGGSDDAYAISTQDIDTSFNTISFRYKINATSTGNGNIWAYLTIFDNVPNTAYLDLLYIEGLTVGSWQTVSFTKADLLAIMPSGFHFNAITTLTLFTGMWQI